MEPNSHHSEAAPFKLPEVQTEPEVEFSDTKKTTEKGLSQAIERAGTTTTLNPASTNPPISFPGVTSSGIDPSAPLTQAPAAKQIPVSDDLPANETDLIEKAWVTKAKAIVEQTKDDPFQQTNELNKIKADYQQKRFKQA